MWKLTAAFGLAFLGMVVLAACGGSGSFGVNSNPGGGSGMSQVSFSISDTPPAGVTILRFQIQLTTASLQPAAMGQPPVSMLPAPVEVELIHLQTEPELLANLNVAAGTYDGLTATFANAQATIFNESANNLTVGNQTCDTGQVCTLNLALNQMNVTVQAPTAPFPITLTSNSPLALLLHFDVNASVQGDLSVSPTISLKELPAPPLLPIEGFHLVGTVTSVTSPTFMLQTGFGNFSFTITTNNNTQYNFGASCPADNFGCIVNGQVLKVFVNLMSGGTLVASQVELFEPPGFPAIEGVVISSNPAQNTFQIVLTDFQNGPAQVAAWFGLRLTIQPTASATFAFDTDGITVPAGLSFASVQDIVIGQAVEVHPTFLPPVAAEGPAQFFTLPVDSVLLEASEITGTVTGVNPGATPPNFILGGLPPLLAKAGITQITVEAVSGTDFENVSGVGGINTGDTVSVGGLVFNTSGQPTDVAERVFDRSASD
ncbi:MAG TPA: DUF4382 domain-containing protein [Candidatus Sulfotelmatobacter sp.]|nr:DUF4382 domain-containing protein [Candidatus Sulfotelmatobacter sp.]